MKSKTVIGAIKKTYTYSEYRQLSQKLITDKSCTGDEISPERVRFTKLNEYWMKRLDKTFLIDPELKAMLQENDRELSWLVIAESWCGDTGQNLPIIAKLAEMSPYINLEIILRDEHPEIMDQYLTNGGRAIPKLICFDRISGKELGTWGPRPARISQMVQDYKKENIPFIKKDFLEKLHQWYTRDRGAAIQDDFKKLLRKWNNKPALEKELTYSLTDIKLMVG